VTMGEDLGCGGGYEKGWVWSCGWGGGGGNHHGRYVLRLQPQRKKFLVASSPQYQKKGGNGIVPAILVSLDFPMDRP
jgi:hypothetical protein